MDVRMTALPRDVVAELKTRIAELEQQLQAGNAENARLYFRKDQG
jgi:two-component system, NtrC family, sensor kinase